MLLDALNREHPADTAGELRAIADEILGPSDVEEGNLRTGLMNREGAVEMLSKLKGVLEKLLSQHGKELTEEDVRACSRYIDLLGQRVQGANEAKDRASKTIEAIRKSAGGFSAYAG